MWSSDHVTRTFQLQIIKPTLHFSRRVGWVKLEGASSALITARLALDNAGARCIGTVLARNDCWAFLKGGFVLDWPTQTSVIFFQVSICDNNSPVTQPYATTLWHPMMLCTNVCLHGILIMSIVDLLLRMLTRPL
jgi:hypothetical protein